MLARLSVCDNFGVLVPDENVILDFGGAFVVNVSINLCRVTVLERGFGAERGDALVQENDLALAAINRAAFQLHGFNRATFQLHGFGHLKGLGEMEVRKRARGNACDARIAQIAVHTAQDGSIGCFFNERVGLCLKFLVARVHRDRGERRASVERIADNARDACGDVQSGHCRISPKCVCADCLKRGGEGYGLQSAATREGIRADFIQAAAFCKGYGLQLRACVKRARVDRLDCCGDLDRLQLFRAVEDVCRHMLDALG